MEIFLIFLVIWMFSAVFMAVGVEKLECDDGIKFIIALMPIVNTIFAIKLLFVILGKAIIIFKNIK